MASQAGQKLSSLEFWHCSFLLEVGLLPSVLGVSRSLRPAALVAAEQTLRIRIIPHTGRTTSLDKILRLRSPVIFDIEALFLLRAVVCRFAKQLVPA